MKLSGLLFLLAIAVSLLENTEDAIPEAREADDREKTAYELGFQDGVKRGFGDAKKGKKK